VATLGYGGGMNDPFATAAVHAEEGPAVGAPSPMGFDGLGLSPEQRAEIERIRAESRSGIETLREEMRSGDPERRQAAREALRAGREEVRGHIDGVLTDEQRRTLEERRAQRQASREGRGRQGRSRPGGGPRAANLDALGLSPEQRAEIERIRTESRSGIETLREEMRSADPADRKAAREALRDGREEVRGQIGDVLTDEQRRTLEERKAQRQASRRGGATGKRARGAHRGR
jgi:Spy/CpxP family protein refolding chaperone